MKKAKDESTQEKGLPDCPFSMAQERFSFSGDRIQVYRIDGEPTTWRWAVNLAAIMRAGASDRITRRTARESQEILHSRRFQSEWVDLIGRIAGKQGMTAESWTKLRSKATAEWFEGFRERWGMNDMYGWFPNVLASNQMYGRKVILRCENCGQRERHDVGDRPPSALWSQFTARKTCCDRPSLKPVRFVLTLEVYPDISGRAWGGFREEMRYAASSRLTPRLWSDEDLKQKPDGTPWRTGRKEFLAKLRNEAERVFPRMLARVRRLGVHEIISGDPVFQTFWKEVLGHGSLPSSSTPASTIAATLTGGVLKQKYQEDFGRFKFSFGIRKNGIRKIKDYAKGR